LNPAQVDAFLEAAESDPYYTLFLLAFNSGMRQGELFALKPKDVDYVDNRLSVQRAVIATRAGYKDAPEGISETLDTLVVAPPKQGKMRTIKLPRFVVVMLREHAKELARQGQFDWLFTNKVGGLIWASDFNRSHFQKIKKAANRALPAGSKLPPSFRFHDIRHTHATLLLEDGVDTKIVSERLGHSSPAFTAATYQHILPPMQDKAADAIDKRGFGKVDRKVKKIRRKPAA
jgi:integrase